MHIHVDDGESQCSQLKHIVVVLGQWWNKAFFFLKPIFTSWRSFHDWTHLHICICKIPLFVISFCLFERWNSIRIQLQAIIQTSLDELVQFFVPQKLLDVTSSACYVVAHQIHGDEAKFVEICRAAAIVRFQSGNTEVVAEIWSAGCRFLACFLNDIRRSWAIWEGEKKNYKERSEREERWSRNHQFFFFGYDLKERIYFCWFFHLAHEVLFIIWRREGVHAWIVSKTRFSKK